MADSAGTSRRFGGDANNAGQNETQHLSFTVQDFPEVFHDVYPIVQEDEYDVARIDYTPDFVTCYDYFRAMLRHNEQSGRALRLTELCLQHNPANYTVWHFRRLCLDNLRAWPDYLAYDQNLAAALGGDNPKNYQIWYHRRALLEKMKDYDGTSFDMLCQQELDYIASVVAEDGKNYHAFSMRQWILTTLADEAFYKKELTFTEQLLEQDVRNNSAWNERWFATHRGQQGVALTADTVHRELAFGLQQIQLDPYNESSMRYWLAVLKEHLGTLEDAQQITALIAQQQAQLVQGCAAVLRQLDHDDYMCVPLQAALVDLYEWRGDYHGAQSLCHSLGENDPIRVKYWQWRQGQLSNKAAAG